MIHSTLEANRVQELDDLLTLIHPRLVQYVAQADPNSSAYNAASLGTYHEPATLKKVFSAADPVFETGMKHDANAVMAHIDDVLKYSVNTWNPGFLDKLYASNNPIGVISDIVLSVLNTNSHVYTVSPVLSVVENQIGHKYASLFYGDAEKCGGLTFSGGSWSNITAMHMARALRYPETKTQGNGSHRFAIYTSRHCHYSVEKAAILLGLGSENVFKVAVLADGSIDAVALERTIVQSQKDGYTPLFINATAGTTVFGSYDDLQALSAIAKTFNAWLHVDGSWGGNVVFSDKHRHRLAGSHLVDSITTNPHKMLGVPTTCSFLLVPDVAVFQEANSLKAPYLFHGREDGENLDLADGTMGCGRRADSFKFHLAWMYYGFQGLRERVDHAYAIVQYFVETAAKTPGFRLVTAAPQCLQVCFYYVPEGFAGTDYTHVTRHVSRELHRRGRYLVDFSPNQDDNTHGEFFRVVFNSPILTDAVVDDLVASIVSVAAEMD